MRYFNIEGIHGTTLAFLSSYIYDGSVIFSAGSSPGDASCVVFYVKKRELFTETKCDQKKKYICEFDPMNPAWGHMAGYNL